MTQQPPALHQTKYVRREEIVTRCVAGVNLLVPVHGCTHCVYTLNSTGNRLWDLIASPRSKNELADSLAELYSVSREVAQHDVDAFLADMVRMDLVVERKEQGESV